MFVEPTKLFISGGYSLVEGLQQTQERVAASILYAAGGQQASNVN